MQTCPHWRNASEIPRPDLRQGPTCLTAGSLGRPAPRLDSGRRKTPCQVQQCGLNSPSDTNVTDGYPQQRSRPGDSGSSLSPRQVLPVKQGGPTTILLNSPVRYTSGHPRDPDRTRTDHREQGPMTACVPCRPPMRWYSAMCPHSGVGYRREFLLP